MGKKTFTFGLLVLDGIVLAMSAVFIFTPVVWKLFGYDEPPIPKLILYGLLFLSCVLFLPLGLNYARTKQNEDFNEFGVRKKDAKLRMSSWNRERVESLQLAETERILSSSDLKRATKKGSLNPEEDLNKMIGLPLVKEKIKDMEARMEFDASSKKNRKKNHAEDELHHMVFYGAPGTGKTAVARIITGLLYDYGYIEQNKIVEVDGNFLKAGDAADTEKKVRMILSKVYGGVLFVDEAYALTQSRDASGKQAIATLIKEMEDNRDKFVAIFAGYPKEMSDMLDTNPGFRSRIKDYIEFPSYSDAELCQIAISMAGEKGFAIDGNAFQNLTERLESERKSSSWGNARTVRSVIEESIDNHAVNFQKGVIPSDTRYKIMQEDIKVVVSKHI